MSDLGPDCDTNDHEEIGAGDLAEFWEELARELRVQLTEAQQETARLRAAMRQYVTDSECYCCDEGIAVPVPCTHCVMKELAGTKAGV